MSGRKNRNQVIPRLRTRVVRPGPRATVNRGTRLPPLNPQSQRGRIERRNFGTRLAGKADGVRVNAVQKERPKNEQEIIYKTLHAKDFGISQGTIVIGRKKFSTRWCELTCCIVASMVLGRESSFHTNLSLSDSYNFWHIFNSLIFNIHLSTPFKQLSMLTQKIVEFMRSTRSLDLQSHGMNILAPKIFGQLLASLKLNFSPSEEEQIIAKEEMHFLMRQVCATEFSLSRIESLVQINYEMLPSVPRTAKEFIDIVKKSKDIIMLFFTGTRCNHCLLVESIDNERLKLWNPSNNKSEKFSFIKIGNPWPFERNSMTLTKIYKLK